MTKKHEAADTLDAAVQPLYDAARALQDALPQIDEGDRSEAEQLAGRLESLAGDLSWWVAHLSSSPPTSQRPSLRQRSSRVSHHIDVARLLKEIDEEGSDPT